MAHEEGPAGPPGFTAQELATAAAISVRHAVVALEGFLEAGLVTALGEGRFQATPRGLRLSRAVADACADLPGGCRRPDPAAGPGQAISG